MSDSAELVILRLGLLTLLLGFLLLAAWFLSRSLRTPPTARQRPASTTASLTVDRAGQTGLRPGTVLLLAGPMRIGRDDAAGIQLADASVSGMHAELDRSNGGRWRVRDLGSTNGTSVGGKEIGSRAVALEDGTDVGIGTVHFTFHE